MNFLGNAKLVDQVYYEFLGSIFLDLGYLISGKKKWVWQVQRIREVML